MDRAVSRINRRQVMSGRASGRLWCWSSWSMRNLETLGPHLVLVAWLCYDGSGVSETRNCNPICSECSSCRMAFAHHTTHTVSERPRDGSLHNLLPLLYAFYSHCNLFWSYYAHGAYFNCCVLARSGDGSIGLLWMVYGSLLQAVTSKTGQG